MIEIHPPPPTGLTRNKCLIRFPERLIWLGDRGDGADVYLHHHYIQSNGMASNVLFSRGRICNSSYWHRFTTTTTPFLLTRLLHPVTRIDGVYTRPSYRWAQSGRRSWGWAEDKYSEWHILLYCMIIANTSHAATPPHFQTSPNPSLATLLPGIVDEWSANGCIQSSSLRAKLIQLNRSTFSCSLFGHRKRNNVRSVRS